ncbi:MAG TPA: sigma-70 family RNA polymerase sigma factor [Candidatus Krumholzibacteria bacterium]|nr:sigma-70 family RNA polymerase sigma factor [Candidatus Krumholzibacteria bacterium]
MRADPYEAIPRWPERLLELCRELVHASDAGQRDRVVAALWLIANAAVTRYVRFHTRTNQLDPEDVKDIASEKSYAFIQRAADPVWAAETTHPGQVCSYFSTLARNGVVDHSRRQKRWVRPTALEPAGTYSPRAEDRLARRQFAEALRDCVERLTPRARVVWFLRVMLDMPTREIARHPRVNMNPAAVDMMLSRTRAAVRKCVLTKGLEPREIPSGTLALLWNSVRDNLEGDARNPRR